MIFRFPGGKRRLSSQIMSCLSPFLTKTKNYYEPFVGGGSISIAIAKEYPNKEITVNDIDENIYSFWDLISNNEKYEIEELIRLIQIKPTIDLFYELKSKKPKTNIEKAYYAIFFNRCTFSGISFAGPIGGRNQNSKYKVDCRYNAQKLINDVQILADLFQNRLVATNMHFKDFFNLYMINDPDPYTIYCDPPYYMKGKELYPYSMSDKEHHLLSHLLLSNTNPWALSYDQCSEIESLYLKSKILKINTKYSINGKKINWSKKQELLIVSK